MDWQSQIALDAGRRYAVDAPVDERLVFLRKTYLLVLFGLVLAGMGGWIGATTLLGFVASGGGMLVLFLAFLGTFFFARAVRAKPGLNYLAMFLFTTVAGLMLGPILYVATQMAGGKPTIVLNALVVTGTAITGLSGYVLITRKDFSFLRGALTVGIFVLLGLVIVSFFMKASFGLHLLVAAGGALLFAGFTLYDTSRIVRTHPTDDAVGAALDLFLDFFNLFYYVLYLMILLTGRRD